MVAVGVAGVPDVPTAAQLVIVQQGGRSVARPRPCTAMQVVIQWRELTVRALLLGKEALLRTVMTHLKSFDLSAEVLAESGLLILLGAKESWIKAGIGVERDILLETWRKIMTTAYSKDFNWMEKCKSPPFRGLLFKDFEHIVTTHEIWLRQGCDADQLVRYRQMA